MRRSSAATILLRLVGWCRTMSMRQREVVKGLCLLLIFGALPLAMFAWLVIERAGPVGWLIRLLAPVLVAVALGVFMRVDRLPNAARPFLTEKVSIFFERD